MVPGPAGVGYEFRLRLYEPKEGLMRDSRLRSARRLVLLALLLTSGLGATALASSHREAPGISNDPVADNTDLYFFRDPLDPSRLVLISNWIPLEEPAGGPNFFHFGRTFATSSTSTAMAMASRTYVYRVEFTRHVRSGATFLQNTGPVGSPTDANPERLLHLHGQEVPRPLAGPDRLHRARRRISSRRRTTSDPKSFPNGYEGLPDRDGPCTTSTTTPGSSRAPAPRASTSTSA